MATRQRGPRQTNAAEQVLGTPDASLLDIVDNVLNKGVVLSGDLTIGLAQVDLIYARLSVLLCAADRVLPNEESDFMERHHTRHMLRLAKRVARRLDSSRQGAKRGANASRRRTVREGE